MDTHTLTAELTAGMAAARAGDKDQAQHYLRRVLAVDPRNESAWLWLSSVLPTTEEALQCVDQLLAINPHHARAREVHEVLSIRLIVEEAALFKRAADQPPPSTPQRRLLLGEVLVQAGVLSPQQLEQALQLQAKAARKWTWLRRKQPVLLGDILLRHGMVRPEQLEAAVGAQLEGLSSTLSLGGMRRIGEYLVAQSLITPEHLQRGLGRQAELRRQGHALPLGEVLVQLGYIERDQLRQALLQMHEEFTFIYR